MNSHSLFKHHKRTGIFALSCLLSLTASAQFTTGNIVVLQVGNGTAALSNAATPLFLKEYNTSTANQTSPVKIVNIDTSGAARLTLGGTTSSEGQITLSSDSTRIVIAGYDAAAGTASVGSTASAVIPRAIDTVSINGIPGRADTTQTVFSGGNIRSATRNASENYWAAGSVTGIYYMGNTAAPDTIYNASTNLRVIQAANGKLYFSIQSGLSRIGRINSQPTTGFVTADTMITLGTGTTPSPYGFAVNAAENVVYVADDRNTTSGGGIQKWTKTGSTWTLAYTISTGGTTGARGLAVDWSGTYNVIYATTAVSAANTLIRITDSSASGASPVTTLATAPTNTAFRGVVMSPRIGCTAPVATISPNPASTCQGETVTLRTNSASGLTYTWKQNGVVLTGAGTTDSTLKVSTGGVYKVIVQNSGGCKDSSANDTVTINPLPTNVVQFISNDTLCAGDSLVVRSSSGQGNTYQWMVNSSVLTSSSDSNFTLTISAGAPTAVNLTLYSIITSAAGCKDTSAPVNVLFNPLPTPAIVNNSGVLSTGSFGSYQWYQNGSAIPGATSATYIPTVNGNYSVRVTNANGCSATSAEVAITGLGVNTLQSKGIRIYPNPVSNEMHVDAPLAVRVVIKDMQGRIVRNVQDTRNISITDLPSGVFAASVYDVAGALLGTQMIVKTAH